jgi:hypothetical protein
MIKNTGEPGGGPFFVRNGKGVSLQIVESSQIDMNDPAKKAIFSSSTHFNPVLMACTLRNFRGEKFDLRKFVDKKACFVTNKSFNGKEIKRSSCPDCGTAQCPTGSPYSRKSLSKHSARQKPSTIF